MRVFKVAIVGNGFVGKTTLLRRYSTGAFQQSRVMTIGVDFQTVLVPLDGETVKLTVWDIAGQDRFASLRDSFYRGSRAVALAYDVSNPESLRDLPRWQEEASRNVPNARLLVLALKIDLPAAVPRQEALVYADSLPAPFFEASSLTGQGVAEFFLGLACCVLEEQPPPELVQR
ncbi:MAG: GTP-binding protein [Chloroflexi bacterium]|nr:GTP-binding protein [Chloroflexota bacterium]